MHADFLNFILLLLLFGLTINLSHFKNTSGDCYLTYSLQSHVHIRIILVEKKNNQDSFIANKLATTIEYGKNPKVILRYHFV